MARLGCPVLAAVVNRAPKTGLCGTCRRHIPLRKDRRLSAHLAQRSSATRREACEGSGCYSARVRLLSESGQQWQDRDAPWSRAAEFNADAEWSKADALYAEYRDMVQCGAASWEAEHATYEAYSRAWDEAQNLSRGLCTASSAASVSVLMAADSGRYRSVTRWHELAATVYWRLS
jgi:hypothetical protein